jgi:CrcB protein
VHLQGAGETHVLKFMWIGLGGFGGAILRYLVSGWVQSAARSADFPYGTMAVNMIGCLLIGVLSQVMENRGVLSAELRWCLLVGGLGAFTTFSTFGNETFNLFRDGRSTLALANIGFQVILGLALVWGGRIAAGAVWR